MRPFWARWIPRLALLLADKGLRHDLPRLTTARSLNEGIVGQKILSAWQNLLGVATLRRRPAAGIRATRAPLAGAPSDHWALAGVQFLHGVRISRVGAEDVPRSVTAVFPPKRGPCQRMADGASVVVVEHFLVELFRHGSDKSPGAETPVIL